MKKIELINGFELEGNDNFDNVLILSKKINYLMEITYKGVLGNGSESNAMDERDDVFYEFEGKLEELGWKLI
jgi:hypothetical protein